MEDGGEVDVFSAEGREGAARGRWGEGRGESAGGNGAGKKGKVVKTHSNMTIDTASLRILSPKMTLYSCGSTLYVLKMARMVTGSVALSVLPKMKHSSRESEMDSRCRRDHSHTRILGGANRKMGGSESECLLPKIDARKGWTYPITTALTNVPANAKMRMTPKLRKKFSCEGRKSEDESVPGRYALRSPCADSVRRGCQHTWRRS